MANGYPYPQDTLIMMTLAALANSSTAPRPRDKLDSPPTTWADAVADVRHGRKIGSPE